MPNRGGRQQEFAAERDPTQGGIWSSVTERKVLRTRYPLIECPHCQNGVDVNPYLRPLERELKTAEDEITRLRDFIASFVGDARTDHNIA